MSDAAITVVAILLAVILMFVFPLMTMADKKDDITTMTVQKMTTEFTNKIRNTGVITRDNYDNFKYSLGSTGEAYEVNITVQKIDENYAKKASKNNGTIIGDNVYLTEYNTQVMQSLDNALNYTLNEGDIVTVEVKNSSKTIAVQLKNIWYRVTGNETGNIAATSSGMVTTTGK